MPALTAPGEVFRFGPFELRSRPAQLLRDGRRVQLRHQCLELLLLLVEQEGRGVSRDAIRRHLWRNNDRVDHHAAINTAVSNLRIALGDSGREPRFIETLPRRGYRFVAPIEIRETDPVERPMGRLRGWLAHWRPPQVL